jgi:hypothetical protein
MKLTKEEKKLLAIERLFNKFREHFPTVSYMSMRTFAPASYTKINTKENIFPFVLYVVTQENSGTKSRSYSWEQGVSDDEYALYDKNDESYGYYQVKGFVQNILPEAFKGKAFYQEEVDLDIHNLPSVLAHIKIKASAIELEQGLPINKQNEARRLKV